MSKAFPMNHPFLAVLSLTALFAISCTENENNESIPIPNTEQWNEKLSAYNVYQGSIEDLTPTEGFEQLDLNADLFANYAEKQRLVKLPEGTQMTYNGDGLPVFPMGTILVKTFYYFNDKRDESLGKKVIESRLLVKRAGVWNVATYVWNEDQTEALLDTDGMDLQVSWINDKGLSSSLMYHIPNQDECVACHQNNSLVEPIGPSLRNLNIDVNRNGQDVNQLEHLQSIGLMEPFDTEQVAHIPNFKDPSLSINERGRAYLDMNCAHCHNPDGWEKPARKPYDFRYGKELSSTGIADAKHRIENLIQSGEMPYLGTTIVDREGLELITEYLEAL